MGPYGLFTIMTAAVVFVLCIVVSLRGKGPLVGPTFVLLENVLDKLLPNCGIVLAQRGNLL